MNTKHTPGQWLQEEVTSMERHVFDSLGEDGLLGPIAIIKHGDPIELEANAALISAAPDLLDAINKLVKLHADWYKGSAYVPVAFYEKNNAAIAEARAAIAKATGESK